MIQKPPYQTNNQKIAFAVRVLQYLLLQVTTQQRTYCTSEPTLGIVVKDIAVSGGGHVFDSLAGQIGPCVATTTTFLQSSVVQALNRAYGPHHSSHALA